MTVTSRIFIISVVHLTSLKCSLIITWVDTMGIFFVAIAPTIDLKGLYNIID